jgi:DnaJ-class molecular chaperone
VYGKEVTLTVPRWETCDECQGTGAKSAEHI